MAGGRGDVGVGGGDGERRRCWQGVDLRFFGVANGGDGGSDGCVFDIFDEVGMATLNRKSRKLTAYMEFLVSELGESKVRIITPHDPDQRGCQLSIQVINADKSVYDKLTASGVICDWREPDVIRCAPVPLYNTFTEVYRMVEKLKEILNG